MSTMNNWFQMFIVLIQELIQNGMHLLNSLNKQARLD